MSSFRQLMMRNKGGGYILNPIFKYINPNGNIGATVDSDFIMTPNFSSVNGYSVSGGLYIDENIPFNTANSWELQIKFYFQAKHEQGFITCKPDITSNYFYAMGIGDNRAALKATGQTGHMEANAFFYIEPYTLTENAWNILKFQYNNGEYSLLWSLDNGATWTNLKTITSSSKLSNVSKEHPMCIGVQCIYWSHLKDWSLKSPVDLKDFYIKINGEYFLKAVIKEN